MKDGLAAAAKSMDSRAETGRASDYYSVPFEQVPRLVARRAVLVRAGQAYVPRDQLEPLVEGHFRARLSKALVHTARQWASVVAPDETERLGPLVEALGGRQRRRARARLAWRTCRSWRRSSRCLCA